MDALLLPRFLAESSGNVWEVESVAAKEFATPNWAQGVIAAAAGIAAEEIAVRMEDDTRIVFLVHKSRREIIVNKRTGKVMEG